MKSLSTLKKEIQISESAYFHTEERIRPTPAEEYPTTPTGKAAFMEDFLDEINSYPAMSGVYYFYPDYHENMPGHPNVGLFGRANELQPALISVKEFVKSPCWANLKPSGLGRYRLVDSCPKTTRSLILPTHQESKEVAAIATETGKEEVTVNAGARIADLPKTKINLSRTSN